MEKAKKIIHTIFQYVTKYIYFVAPVLAITLFLCLAKAYDIAPVGHKTLSWCDMEQQVIPLLNQFKDVLSGKGNFTYQLSAAGGMSYFGVFFFFLSSPFSLLVLWVDKVDMITFVNILILLKMATASFTFAFYLRKKYPNLNSFFILAFAILYSFSGYVMMYYQNCIWLDIVYLFPLLMLSIDSLFKKGKYIPYIVFTTLIVSVNYYLGIITIFFVVLYVGANFIQKRKEENIKKIATKFIISSLISAFISMVILIPSMMDYLKSARTISIIESIEKSWVITYYDTALPIIFGTLIVLPIIFKKKSSGEKLLKIVLLILLTLPMIFEPIAKAWHFGSYQAFPCRYAFINIFLLLDISSLTLDEVEENSYSLKDILIKCGGLVLVFALVYIAFTFEQTYIDKKISNMGSYATTLWGNQTSFEALLRYYAIILVIAISLFILSKTKIINKRILGIGYLSLAILEACFSFRVYMVVPSRTVEGYQNYYQLADMIQDDSFYRVKTDDKYRNVNDIGAFGYFTLAHYTSLTPEDNMNLLKKLGYSSYWMEVGANGGTTFTDALLRNKYTIYSGSNSEAPYSTDHYHIKENPVYPLGIVTNSNLTKKETLLGNTRSEMQGYLYTTLFGDTLYEYYNPIDTANMTMENTQNGYYMNVTRSDGLVYYSVDVNEKTSLYFEAFDQYTPDLKQSINESMYIRVNGRYVQYSYPSQSDNGSVFLGSFENETVNVTIGVRRTISCSSFSLFGISENRLNDSVTNASHAEMSYKKNRFVGNYFSNGDEYLFLPIAYSSGIKAKINGKQVKVLKVLDGFVSIQLNKGDNQIQIYFTQSGLGIGITFSIMGLALLGAYIYLDKKYSTHPICKKVDDVTHILSCALGVIIFFMLYIAPIILNVIGQIK